ncbi:hypothetical protein N836_00295 [Leptolyngbya sp. Heron Island J]|uniref:hypothetical protein n=1 Tax=Leptolyngbya sp. Heron Island J TaxID=1385935 RepID=UPI0003B99D33|nr:hypothetical protein [Leptolyngbya sp. Heron Island J]ESA37152.1 hypothetical protein N836_00295 [Leptolyngbya sp. Heron Island J]
MAKGAQKDREPGDQIRVNLSGSVADAVVDGSSELGISFSAYVQLRLLGKLDAPETQGRQQRAGQSKPQKTIPVHITPEQPVLTLSELPPL